MLLVKELRVSNFLSCKLTPLTKFHIKIKMYHIKKCLEENVNAQKKSFVLLTNCNKKLFFVKHKNDIH